MTDQAAQLDLFRVQPITPTPRTPSAARRIMDQRPGVVMGREGRLLQTQPLLWTRRPPDRPGYWLSSDGRLVVAHRAIALRGTIFICNLGGLSEEVGAIDERWGMARTPESWGLDWIGPISEPPER